MSKRRRRNPISKNLLIIAAAGVGGFLFLNARHNSIKAKAGAGTVTPGGSALAPQPTAPAGLLQWLGIGGATNAELATGRTTGTVETYQQKVDRITAQYRGAPVGDADYYSGAGSSGPPVWIQGNW